jgi:hypothetical protein
LVRTIEEKQKELPNKGNLEAAINNNIIEGATQAIIRYPEFTDQILQSLVKFDGDKAMIMDEFKKLFDISRNVLRKITTGLPEQPLLSPRTEQLISLPNRKTIITRRSTIITTKNRSTII